MADRKSNALIKWFGAIFLFFVVILPVGMHIFSPKVIEPARSLERVPSPAEPNDQAGSSVVVPQDRGSVSREVKAGDQRKPVPRQPGGVLRSPSAADDQAVTSEPGGRESFSLQAPANPVPTEAQILASIESQDQQRETRDRVVTDRVKQIDKVHRAIMDSGIQDSRAQVKPFVAPLVVPPDHIVQKLKSHELVGH